jgi:hypothetical protein
LEPLVAPPKVVRQIDWIDNVWPRHLKDQQMEVSRQSSSSSFLDRRGTHSSEWLGL